MRLRCYQVRARHRNEEVREVVPSDYGGVMVTESEDGATMLRLCRG